MALTQQHRSAIYDVWAPQLGEEVTEALIAHFPARDLDEPVTKEFVGIKTAELEVKIADLRAEMRQGDASLRADIAELRAEMSGAHAQITKELHESFTQLSNQTHAGHSQLDTDMKRLTSEMQQFALQLTNETNRAIQAIRHDLVTQLRQMTFWVTGTVITLAGLAVSITIAFAR